MHPHHPTYVIDLAARIFGDLAQAAKWLDRPNVQLGGRVPRDMIKTADGARRVEELLAQHDDAERLRG